MSKYEIPYKIYLEEKDIPTSWYNVRADMKNKPAPLIHPGTLQPLKFEDMQPIFCDELIRQELDNDTAYIFYAIYTNIPDLRALLRTINAKRYVVTGSSGRLPFAKSETCGMLRPLTDDPLPDDVFIGLTLN